MKVLSLFDGISCGRLALERAGLSVEKYDAFEIDKYAITVSKNNFPDIVQHGDVFDGNFKEFQGYDLLIGGSPCQGFSYSGKMLNFNDSRSKLFFEFVRAIKEAKPKYFLLENVKMKQEWQDIISNELGVKPIEINSKLVSAQNRVRLYWTNIPNVTVPDDRGICLKDILENVEFPNPAAIRGRNVDLSEECLKSATIVGRRLDSSGHRKDENLDIPITQCLEVRDKNTDKSNCLTTVDKDNVLTPLPYGRYADCFGKITGEKLPFRYYTNTEYERLQTLPDGYTSCAKSTVARRAIGNGWTVDVIAHIFSALKITDNKA